MFDEGGGAAPLVFGIARFASEEDRRMLFLDALEQRLAARGPAR
jgi:hypothetical protein